MRGTRSDNALFERLNLAWRNIFVFFLFSSHSSTKMLIWQESGGLPGDRRGEELSLSLFSELKRLVILLFSSTCTILPPPVFQTEQKLEIPEFPRRERSSFSSHFSIFGGITVRHLLLFSSTFVLAPNGKMENFVHESPSFNEVANTNGEFNYFFESATTTRRRKDCRAFIKFFMFHECEKIEYRSFCVSE